MWWKEAEDERTLEVPLGFIATRHDLRCEAVCLSCGAHQSVYLAELLAEHGATATLGTLKASIPCFFCEERGTLRLRLSSR